MNTQILDVSISNVELINLCVLFTHAYVFACVWVHVHTHMRMWSPRLTSGIYLYLSLPTSFSEVSQVSHWTWSSTLQLVQHASTLKIPFLSPESGITVGQPGMCAGDPNSSPYARVVSTLFTKPFPQALYLATFTDCLDTSVSMTMKV